MLAKKPRKTRSRMIWLVSERMHEKRAYSRENVCVKKLRVAFDQKAKERERLEQNPATPHKMK